MSNIHALQKIFPAGFDNGYGSLKLFVDGFEVVRIPSYISTAEMEDVPGRIVLDGAAYTPIATNPSQQDQPPSTPSPPENPKDVDGETFTLDFDL